MRMIRYLGYFFLALGIILLLDGLKITGLVIFEEVNQRDVSFIGIILIILGVLLLKSYSATIEEAETYDGQHLKGRKGLRIHNGQAHYAARRHFIEQYGRFPDKQELREYTRSMHENGDLHDIVEDRKHRKKSA